MFIPLDRKPDWRSPPVITLLLISINILVFTFLQAQDPLREEAAFRYYFSSGLAELEIPHYLQYLNENSTRHLRIGSFSELDPVQKKSIYQHQLSNGRYQNALDASQIIRPDNIDYTRWQGLRRGFKQRLQSIFTYRYALKPYLHEPLTVLSAMFLHSNASHLLGNMVFLLLFGFILELALGGGLLLLVYISCGVSANLISIVVSPYSGQWIIGASGAITGLAGLYAVLYGMRKIRFFYSLIFYFDYVRAPAIIMLPVWLLYEFAYSLIAPDSISSVTHIGGLLAGILIGLIIKYSPLDIDPHEEEKTALSDFETEFQKAMDALAKSDLNRATHILTQLHQKHPQESRVLLKLFHIAKARRDKTSAQHYLLSLLALRKNNSQLVKEQQRSFVEYLELSGGEADLPTTIMLETAIRFCQAGIPEESEKILALVIKKNPAAERIPALLLLLSTRYHKSANTQKSRQYKQLLLRHFPNSAEARSIQEILPAL